MSSFVVNDKSFADFASIGGATFSRALAGYGQTVSGVWVPYASGVIRRPDRGVLIEEARTNLALQSQTLTNAAWNANAVAVTTGETDPAGGTGAFLLTESSAGAIFRTLSAISVAAASPYAVTFYAKRSNVDWIRLTVADSSGLTTNGCRGWFNLATGAVGSSAVFGTGWSVTRLDIRAAGSGYYACTIVFAPAGTSLFAGVLTASADLSTTRADIGGGAGVGGAFRVWTIQAELLPASTAQASSPIATTTASATRPKDALREIGAAISTPWTIYAEAEFLGSTATTQSMLYLSAAGSSNDRILIQRTSTDLVTLQAVSAGVTVSSQSSAAKAGARTVKAAISYDGTYRASVDGTGLSPTTAAAPAVQLDQIDYGQNNGGNNALNGYLRKARVLPYALGQTDLNSLTA